MFLVSIKSNFTSALSCSFPTFPYQASRSIQKTKWKSLMKFFIKRRTFQKMYGWHGLEHQIVEYLKKEKVMTDRQTDRQADRQTDRQADRQTNGQSKFPLVDLTPSVEGVD